MYDETSFFRPGPENQDFSPLPPASHAKVGKSLVGARKFRTAKCCFVSISTKLGTWRSRWRRKRVPGRTPTSAFHESISRARMDDKSHMTLSRPEREYQTTPLPLATRPSPAPRFLRCSPFSMEMHSPAYQTTVVAACPASRNFVCGGGSLPSRSPPTAGAAGRSNWGERSNKGTSTPYPVSVPTPRRH